MLIFLRQGFLKSIRNLCFLKLPIRTCICVSGHAIACVIKASFAFLLFQQHKMIHVFVFDFKGSCIPIYL